MTLTFRHASIATILLLASGAVLHAQAAPDRTRFAALDRQWRTSSVTDTVLLTRLTDSTSLRGETGARVLLGIVADSTLHPVPRLYALWGLQAYWGQWIITCEYRFPYSGRATGMHEECVRGDGLRRVPVPAYDPAAGNPTIHPGGELRAASIEAALRDTIVAGLRDVLRQRGGVTEAVGEFLRRYAGVERWSDDARVACERSQRAWTTAAAMQAGVPRLDPLEGIVRYGCTDTGPPLLDRMWRRVEADTTSLYMLALVSGRLRDRRILDALIATAADARRPEQVRMAAMAVLGAQLHQGVLSSAVRSLHRIMSRPFVCDMPMFDEAMIQWNGAQPLDQPALARGRRALEDLAATGNSPGIRHHGAAVAACARDVAEATRTFIAR